MTNLVEIIVVLHDETEEAWKVSQIDNHDHDYSVWILKSQAKINFDGIEHTLTCPECLAIDEGLV